MLDQRIEDDPFEDRVSETDRDKTVLNLLFGDPPWPWTVDEIARELDTHIGARDSVSRLQRAGLVHKLGEFVFPTRAACRADQIGAGEA
jgi:hypothetical protein